MKIAAHPRHHRTVGAGHRLEPREKAALLPRRRSRAGRQNTKDLARRGEVSDELRVVCGLQVGKGGAAVSGGVTRIT